MSAPTPARVAKAKERVVAALRAFEASCQRRNQRLTDLFEELAEEHDRDAGRLYAVAQKFVETVDPESRLVGEVDQLFMNWSPGEVEVPDEDTLLDILPSSDVGDALDDVDTALAELRDLYADDDG